MLQLAYEGRHLTTRDLDAIEHHEGWRLELLDGVLLVSPSPRAKHQIAVLEVAKLLDPALPPDLRVMVAPFDWDVDELNRYVPDVMVVRNADIETDVLVGNPVLAVEVRSPSTAIIDRTAKLAAYDRAGLEAYWIVDPHEPAVTVYRRTDDGLVEVATSTGDEPCAVGHPVALRVVPADLVR